MKALFDKSKYTQWFVDKSGKMYCSTTYRGRNYSFREIKPTLNRKRGYMYSRTSNGNYQVHRLVASAFIPNPENKPYVNHIDGDKTNNSINNLEWVTAIENAQHALLTGLTRQMKKNQGNVKYTNEECAEIIEAVNQGITYREAGKIHNMPYSTVAHLIRGSRRLI
jgi:hypothetical protein